MDFKKLAPSDIFYGQDSISNTFRDGTKHTGQYIGKTLNEIVSNPDTADLIPKISVFKKDDKWFTSDNRRLWVFKKAQKLGILSSIDVCETYGIEDSKFTTSDGKYVDIRGIDPGRCLWKSLQVKIRKEKQQREREQQMEIERQGRVKQFAIGLIAVSIVLYLIIGHHHSN